MTSKKRCPNSRNNNSALNELQELIQITARGMGFGTDAMDLIPRGLDKILGALDNLANATVQKTNTTNKSAAVLYRETEKN